MKASFAKMTAAERGCRNHFYFELLCFSVFLLFTMFHGSSSAQDLSAYEIMEKVYAKEQAETISSTVEMLLTGKDGLQRTRTIESSIKRYGKETKKAVFFLTPPDVKGTGFLTYDYSNPDQEDEQWIYLPAMHKTKRISAAGRTGSFMGSDFSYGDMTEKSLEEYSYTLLKEHKTPDYSEWVIEALPVDETVIQRFGYSKSLLLVRQDNFVITKAVHWIPDSNILKYYEITDLKLLDGFWVPIEVRAKTVNNGETLHQTVLRNSSTRINMPIAEELFTIQRLEQGF